MSSFKLRQIVRQIINVLERFDELDKSYAKIPPSSPTYSLGYVIV